MFEAPEQWCTHIEWLIKNCPDKKLMTWVTWAPESVSAEKYALLKECYLQKVKRNPKNANVTGNTAGFCRYDDYKLAQKLYKKARKLAADDWRWSSRLCFFYSYESRLKNDSKLAQKAYRVGNKCIKRFERVPHHRLQVFEIITHLCELALRLDDSKRARRYVKELKYADFSFISPYVKHYYKGLFALKEGNIGVPQFR